MQMKIFFFGLECFMIVLFVIFYLIPLKAMICNFNFKLLVCDCECFI